MTDSDRYFVGIPDMYAEGSDYFQHATFIRETAEDKFHVVARLASGDALSEQQVVEAQYEMKMADDHSGGLEQHGTVFNNVGDIAAQTLSTALRIVTQH
ncbi:hypothetical protein AB0M47_03255 [Hamadaea sp. NPDC051192]|uniref:hypothetical protein n=1 Tax=Hamadaea sp. NPDC051192 TaxID=3154940 RepID=UPI00343B3ADC